MDFFSKVFGFSEQRGYEDTRQTLLKAATFSDCSIEIPSKALTQSACPSSKSDNDSKKQRDELSIANHVVPRERCLLALPTQTLDCGIFWTPSVAELRAIVQAELLNPNVKEALRAVRAEATAAGEAFVSVSNIIGDSRALHSQVSKGLSPGGVFQAASQFNYLEFPSPDTLPEHGIAGYAFDRTQGPACAMACAAGTAYRNYLAKVDTVTFSLAKTSDDVTRGQCRSRQFNGLFDIERLLGQPREYFDVSNGYVDSSVDRLKKLNQRLKDDTDGELKESIISKLRIAVQQDTQVTDSFDVAPAVRSWRSEADPPPPPLPGTRTLPPGPPLVTQTYNSALSLGYSTVSGWDQFAQIILMASYEATIMVGLLQTLRSLVDSHEKKLTPKQALSIIPPIVLTKVGGGVFGNRAPWIINAMKQAFTLASFFRVPLDIRITHYGSVELGYVELSKFGKNSN